MPSKRVAFINGVPVDKGGIETSIMNVYRHIDTEKLQIDFIVRKPQQGYYHEEIEDKGGKIINIFEKKKHKGNKRWNLKMDLYSVFWFYRYLKKNKDYQAVHFAHPLLDGLLIISAFLARVPVRIVHSNNTGIDDYVKTSFLRRLTRKIRIALSIKFATHIWACSRAAGEYMFGKGIFEDPRFEVVPYPVELKEFQKQGNRDKVEKELGLLPSSITFTNVGRYAFQKNQLFLLDVFSELLKTQRDLQLILTGPGPLEKEIREKVIKLELTDFVFMLDSATPIPRILEATDFFLLPSIYEGFGIVLIEAQAMGIPCFVSTECQPEANQGLIEYLPLEKGVKYWADYILTHLHDSENKKADIEGLKKYDTTIVAPRMQQVYLEGIAYNINGALNNKEES